MSKPTGKAMGKGGPKQSAPKPAGSGSSRSVVPRGVRPLAVKKQDGIIVPEGYTMRKVEPAKNYDVVSFARAMNDDFAPRLQKLFEPETEAAVTAQKTGIYIGWRCPEFKHDCQRLSIVSKCFCGHILEQHGKFSGNSVRVPCKNGGCSCKAFAWIPSRPEDIGEFWHQRRPDFDPSTWRAKCRCKHTHEQHDPTGMRRCKSRGCSCGHFDSNFLCAACDRHWEDHETFFDTEATRREKGLPYGEAYLPFADMPDLRNIALTGCDSDESRYKALTQGEGAIPMGEKPVGNDAPVNFSVPGSRFKPVYD
ncbi:hypothetical protein ScPMuIL_018049 [Solemya velum]